MNAHIELSLTKLSAPVEVLNLSQRTCRALQRAGVFSVAEMILAGRLGLSAKKNIAEVTIGSIFTAMARYLDLTEEQLANAAAPAPRSRSEDPKDVWRAPVRALGLSTSTFQALEYMGYARIEDLIRARSDHYRSFLGVSDQELAEIDRALRYHLAQAAHTQLQAMICPESPQTPVMDPDPVFALPKLPERIWAIIRDRAMQHRTLVELGHPKTMRAVIRQTHELLYKNLHILRRCFDHFEERASLLLNSLEHRPLDLKTLVQQLMPDPASSSLTLEEEDVERTILLLRSLALHPSPWFAEEIEGQWPTLLLLSGLAEPALFTYKPVRRILRRWERKKREMTYSELAHAVLAREGRPMHWTEMAREAVLLKGRASVHARSLQGSLFCHKGRFVHVGGGRYGLAEWGCEAGRSYAEIIALVLRQANRALPTAEIFARVSAIRPVGLTSLKMSLLLHPRFYRSLQGTFGLRGWLPVSTGSEALAEPGTMPDWLIENLTSRRRVERAAAQGLDVGKFLREDRLELPSPIISSGEDLHLCMQNEPFQVFENPGSKPVNQGIDISMA